MNEGKEKKKKMAKLTDLISKSPTMPAFVHRDGRRGLGVGLGN